MGCAGAKEKIEDKMLLVKLERMEIQMEKEKHLKKLEEIEGHTIRRSYVPDYIDPKFAREKQIYDDEDIEDKRTDDYTKKGKTDKKKLKKGKRGKSKKGKKEDNKKKIIKK